MCVYQSKVDTCRPIMNIFTLRLGEGAGGVGSIREREREYLCLEGNGRGGGGLGNWGEWEGGDILLRGVCDLSIPPSKIMWVVVFIGK